MGGRPLLEAVGSDLEGQGYGEHRRDVTVDVLARTPDIGEPLAAPKTRPGSCFTDRGNGSLELVTHREVFGETLEEILRFPVDVVHRHSGNMIRRSWPLLPQTGRSPLMPPRSHR